MQLNLCSYLAFVVSRYCTLFVMFVLLEKVELDLSHSCWWVWNSLYWTVRRGLIYRIIGGFWCFSDILCTYSLNIIKHKVFISMD